MALVKRGKHWFGDSASDIRGELIRYSARNYLADHFADSACECGRREFRLLLDDTEGAAVRVCNSCGGKHPIGDSADYLKDASLEECECPCGGGVFEISAGAALYQERDDVRWFYLGCRCLACGLVACYGDWKIGGGDYHELLSRV